MSNPTKSPRSRVSMAKVFSATPATGTRNAHRKLFPAALVLRRASWLDLLELGGGAGTANGAVLTGSPVPPNPVRHSLCHYALWVATVSVSGFSVSYRTLGVSGDSARVLEQTLSVSGQGFPVSGSGIGCFGPTIVFLMLKPHKTRKAID